MINTLDLWRITDQPIGLLDCMILGSIFKAVPCLKMFYVDSIQNRVIFSFTFCVKAPLKDLSSSEAEA